MKCDFLILGCGGMQGRIVMRDLLESGYKVYGSDLYRDGAEKVLAKYRRTPFKIVDLRHPETVEKFIKSVPAKIVINCAEGDYNLDVYKICLKLKKHVIDLGSDIPMTKAQMAMNGLFKKADLTAITGCGSTPGINNVMLKYASGFFREMETVELGFAWDSEIKKFVVPFSIESVIEELSDPGPFVDKGKWLEKPPLSTEVVREFREIGSQKCYIVRHPETYSIMHDYKKFKIKNLRFYAGFPDHSLEAIKWMIDLGLGKKDKLDFEKTQIRPVDALSRILTRLPRPENYTEKENLWVEISGKNNKGGILIMRMECLVFPLPGWPDDGCNVDTGLPASIIAQMISDGRIKKRGSFAPDTVVPPGDFFRRLKEKGITVYQDGKAI